MNKSKIIRNRRQNGFTIVSNVARLEKSISFRALGLLTYLMGLPEGWSITIESLATVKTDGRTSVTAGLNELMNVGFLQRTRRYENGRFVCYDYIISDEKDFSTTQQDTAANIDDYQQTVDYRNTESGKPEYGKPESGNTESGKPDFSISDFRKPDHLYNKEDNNKDYNKHTVDLKIDSAGEVDKPSEHKQEVNTPTAPKKDKYADTAISIITELNTVTSRNFRQTDANMKYIRARLREGFTPDDFNAVIAFKTSQWSARADMKAYLRPETLFGAKFDAYLQEARQAQAARPVVEEGASGAYANYLKYAAKYSALGASALLTQSEHHNLTEGEALSLYRRTFTKHELTALFHKAHEEANEAVRRGQAVRVADVFKRLTNEASRPK
jgi:uncharacterized phage protein (TIGR02220 family)